MHIASQAEILMRGFARVGIVALIDEVTGYQRDRKRDALAAILEKYIAKEMRPWLKTFQLEFLKSFAAYGVTLCLKSRGLTLLYLPM